MMAPSERPKRNVVLHMMTTLDGCVSGPNGELDWLFAFRDKQRDDYVFKLYKGVDDAIVGRTTYESMAAYWPKAETGSAGTSDDKAFAHLMNTMRKHVFSKTLDRVEWSNSELHTGDMTIEVGKLKSLPGRDILLCGGLTTARNMMGLGLIDEYQLIVHPVVLGDGRRLFEGTQKKKLRLLGATPFKEGVVAMHYAKEESKNLVGR